MVRPANLQGQSLPGLRGRAAAFVEHRFFTRLIIVLILANAATLGLETNGDIIARFGTLLHGFDALVLTIFTFELGLKIFAYRLDFFRVGWNIFDLVIVTICFIPQSAGLSILRGLRVLRLFRLITLVPQMRSVVGALLHAIPGMASIIGILLVLVYIAAVLAVQLFGHHPDAALQGYFGTLGASMYTMFQLLTLEDWAEIAQAAMTHYPWAWAFFIPYIIITTFAVLNLFIGIIVDALNIVKEQDIEEEKDDILDEIRSLRREVAALRKALDGGKKN